MWEKAIGKFPFGLEIKQIKQNDRSPKEVFVLGKYASALHGKFISKDTRNLRNINALAIDSEPCIFWDGNNAENLINQVNKIVPPEIGKFELPDNIELNGPSGKALDKYYLEPLKLVRNDVWMCDLIPQFLVNKNDSQYNAQTLLNKYLEKINMVKFQSNIPFVPTDIDSDRIMEIKNELIQSNARTIILLGQDTLKWFISKISDFHKTELKEINPYGMPFDIRINGLENTYKVYAFAHMHHIEKPIGKGKEWREKHFDWINRLKV
jgi:hypothetical protein